MSQGFGRRASMIYRFKSKATGDTIMLAQHGALMLRLIGREPSDQGIIEAAALPAAVEALRQAVVADDAARAGVEVDAGPGRAAERDTIALGRRLWPVIQMFERAHDAGAAVVWGV